MPNFFGQFDCKLDVKGRLALPSKLKNQLPEVDTEGLVANFGYDKNIVIYTREVWKYTSDEVNKLSVLDADNRQFKRLFTGSAAELMPDGSSRVLLPKFLMDYAGISLNAEVKLVCQVDTIELWDKATYDSLMNIAPAAYSNLAQTVLKKSAGKGSHE